MPASLLPQIISLFGLLGCLFSLWKGGPPERIGGAVVLATLLLTILATTFLPVGVQPIAELVIDGLAALGLLGVVLIYGSLWLGGAMLLYATQFSLYAYYFVAERPNDRFHAIVNNLDFMGITLCLIIGTAVAWRRRVRAART
ncbi:hypothetical protein [Phenylobacterium sp.]|uniref:hypothetical protein n=1 Tax=Phenylobacterium sp. TaxID=1871053 RepID=UPI0035633955